MAQSRRIKTVQAEEEGELTLRDAVQQLAAENNVAFVPHPARRKHDGKQLYKFGSCTIFLHRDIVYVESSPGKFSATSLSQLVDAALREGQK